MRTKWFVPNTSKQETIYFCMFSVNKIYYKACYVLMTSCVLANTLGQVEDISVHNPYDKLETEGQYARWLSTGLHGDGKGKLRVKPGPASSLRPQPAPPFGPKIVYHQDKTILAKSTWPEIIT